MARVVLGRRFFRRRDRGRRAGAGYSRDAPVGSIHCDKLARLHQRDPPPSIDRAAAVFLKTDGSIRKPCARLSLLEFFSPTAYRAKVRTPLEFVAAMRALNAETDGDRPVMMRLPVWASRYLAGLLRRLSDRATIRLSSGTMVAVQLPAPWPRIA
jgi:uncharacterized protein (DUF1800 family)